MAVLVGAGAGLLLGAGRPVLVGAGVALLPGAGVALLVGAGDAVGDDVGVSLAVGDGVALGVTDGEAEDVAVGAAVGEAGAVGLGDETGAVLAGTTRAVVAACSTGGPATPAAEQVSPAAATAVITPEAARTSLDTLRGLALVAWRPGTVLAGGACLACPSAPAGTDIGPPCLDSDIQRAHGPNPAIVTQIIE